MESTNENCKTLDKCDNCKKSETYSEQSTQLPPRASYYSVGNLDNTDDKCYSSDEEYALEVLKHKGITPKRGDIIIIGFPDFDRNKHYRNEGFHIYNGQYIIPLGHEPDNYGTIPKEFEGIKEFPIRYWTDIMSHNSFIYCNHMAYLKGLSVNSCIILPRRDGKGRHAYVAFLGPDDKLYYICDNSKNINPNKESINMFIEKLKENTYLCAIAYIQDVRDLIYSSDPESLEDYEGPLDFLAEGLDPENVLTVEYYI